MDALEAVTESATAVSYLTSRFMLDGSTYKRGAELGFAGLDFYITGRGGVLGDVDADVVTATFAFFHPDQVRTQWDAGRQVMSPEQAAAEFTACAYRWAEEHVPDHLDSARLAELAGKVAAAGRIASAPIFAAWRRMPAPESPKAAAIHHMNALRELRQQLHAGCVFAHGVSPHQAVSVNGPGMAGLYGYPELAPVDDELRATLARAEEATNLAVSHTLDALTAAERAEFVELANAIHAASA